MGFITFNENYYKEKLNIFESKKLTLEDVYEIRQLLKVLDDLSDEGYTNLNDHMEADFSCLSRLRSLLKKEGASPFPILHEEQKSITYPVEEKELSESLDELMMASRNEREPSGNPFLKEIRKYCEWIGYEKDTAYVFLLRDTLLPYVYFKSRHKKHCYPWLVSRKFLEDVTKTPFVDDDIRLSIYEALENGHTDFLSYSFFTKEGMLDVLNHHLPLKNILLDLLHTVDEKKIVVIESGYMGTIPMMLKALDDRVTFCLYTTAPFLYETYKDNIFCRRYEDVREFETLSSQNLLMQYASFHDGRFYVNVLEDEEIRKSSLREINDLMNGKHFKNKL